MKHIIIIGIVVTLITGIVWYGCASIERWVDNIYVTDIYAKNIGSATEEVEAGYFSKLYLDGVDLSTPNYAGMYKYNSAAASNIQVVNAWHLANGFTTSLVGGGWVFHAGEQVPITAYANNGDGKTIVTSAGHVLVNDDVISIAGTVNYDGVWVVEQIALNTFVIDTAFVADDGASVGEHGSHFQSAVVTSTGRYLVSYSMSIKPNNPNDIVEVATFLNNVLQEESLSRTKLGAITDYQNVVGFSLIDVTVNDVVGCGLRNITGAGDFVVIHANTTLHRID